MTNSELFKKAHAMTRQTVRTGDSYAVTFGACLKSIRSKVQYNVRIESGAAVQVYAVRAVSDYDAQMQAFDLFSADYSERRRCNAEVTLCEPVIMKRYIDVIINPDGKRINRTIKEDAEGEYILLYNMKGRLKTIRKDEGTNTVVTVKQVQFYT